MKQGKAFVLGLMLAAPLAALAQTVRLDTSMGDIVIELDAKAAPRSVANFMQYVREGHYDGTVFHRVIAGFMIQGGGMDAKLAEKPTHDPIPLESHNGLANTRGAVAMARTAMRDSATAQFFIDVVDNPFLDQGDGYAVFGKVVKGMDVVDRIRKVETTTLGPYQDVPKTPVVIRHAVLEK